MISGRRCATACSVALCLASGGAIAASGHVTVTQLGSAILLDGTVVTMNATRDVMENGHVLVRNGRIAAIWRGERPPDGVSLDGVLRPRLGAHPLIFPGLINLHDHPFYDALPLWQTPSSHVQPALGRPTGLEPYANRGQWRGMRPEHKRLVDSPATILDSFR